MSSLKVIAALVATANAAAWNYKTENGKDWPDLTDIEGNVCGTSNQSPINLISKSSAAFKYKVYEGKEDAFNKDYTNQVDANPKFNGHTNQVDLVKDDGTTTMNQFNSLMGKNLFKAPTQYNGQQFHFHSGSEHTVDGVRHDLEMHTVHFPPAAENGFVAAAMGIMFSVDKYTADVSVTEQNVIDTFFDSLKWSDQTEAGPTVNLVTYGNLMEMVDNKNRWIYSGSVTTPPCAKSVYWNVLSTIYPLKQKHLDLFKAQLNRGEDGELDDHGNWRLIQKEDDHGVVYLETNYGKTKEEIAKENKGLIAGVIILAVTTLFGLVASGCLWCKVSDLQKPGSKTGDVEMPAQSNPAPEAEAPKQME